MAPSIEQIREGKSLSEEKAFMIVLDDPKLFDPELFIRSAREITNSALAIVFLLKYVVRGNQMIAFDGSLQHSVVNYNLEQMGFVGDLNSAGAINVYPEDDGLLGNIEGYSMTLETILPKTKSYEYRERIMRPVLEQYFRFI